MEIFISYLFLFYVKYIMLFIIKNCVFPSVVFQFIDCKCLHHFFSEFANKLSNAGNFAIITYLRIFELQSIVDGLASL